MPQPERVRKVNVNPDMGSFMHGATGDPDRTTPPRRLSQIFAALAEDARGQVSIRDIRDALGDRSFAALLVIFAAFNLLPLPPGATLVLGPPLILVSWQMAIGRESAWLPEWLLSKAIAAERFRNGARRVVPRLEQVERMIRPRYWPLSRGQADRVIGTVALVLSIAVTLPIPLGNWLPAFSVALIGFALSERDGILLGIGFTIGALSLAIIGAVVGAAGVLAGLVVDAIH